MQCSKLVTVLSWTRRRLFLSRDTAAGTGNAAHWELETGNRTLALISISQYANTPLGPNRQQMDRLLFPSVTTPAIEGERERVIYSLSLHGCCLRLIDGAQTTNTTCNRVKAHIEQTNSQSHLVYTGIESEILCVPRAHRAGRKRRLFWSPFCTEFIRILSKERTIDDSPSSSLGLLSPFLPFGSGRERDGTATATAGIFLLEQINGGHLHELATETAPFFLPYKGAGREKGECTPAYHRPRSASTVTLRRRVAAIFLYETKKRPPAERRNLSRKSVSIN